VNQASPPPVLEEKNLFFKWARRFYCHKTISVKSLKGHKTLTITSAWPRPFFIHNRTPHETGVGPFMPVVQHQYQTVTTTTTTTATATQQQLV